jgi:hypothetical protein
MIELLSSRSRRLNSLRCPRARYWLDEAFGTGFSPVALAIPLVTGGSVHVGLASVMTDAMTGEIGEREIENAVELARNDYQHQCAGRSFAVEELESQSFVYNEQIALTEALVRLAGMRVVPKILELYEVLEVERMDRAWLTGDGMRGLDPSWTVDWRSIPDALLREKSTWDLYILSWKTTAEFDKRKDEDARVDMQGLSEGWAVEERLAGWAKALKTGPDNAFVPAIPNWFIEHFESGGSPIIRGVQMVYLIKGARRKKSKEDMLAGGVTEEQIKAGGGQYKTASPLIYGYVNDPSGTSPKFAWSSDWHCRAPHGMRRSQWYPTGECPGDGRLHRRGDDWKSFPAWEMLTVKTWMDWLADGTVSPEAGDALDQSWAMPVPHYRTRGASESWLRQTRSAEARLARELIEIREYESAWGESRDEGVWDALIARLDETFPQATEKCGNWWGRKCPMWEICHGPGHVAQDPVGSGLFRIKEAYGEAVTTE